MKYIKSIIFLFIFLSINLTISANPILYTFLKELKFDEEQWSLEMYFSPRLYDGPESLDGMYIISSTDTAYFKPGLAVDSVPRVFTNSDLDDTLYINPEGDVVWIGGYLYDYLSFGNTEESHLIAPDTSQSICVRDTLCAEQEINYYLDNSPTLGSLNDSLNAMGTLTILFTDLADNPLRDFQIGYTARGWAEFHDTLTDGNGEFSIHDYAMKIKFFDNDYEYITWKQIFPEVTTYDTIRIDTSESGINDKKIKEEYLLNQNYPNPFKSTTNIIFYIPENEYININLYDITGKRIKNLYSGYKEKGAHTLKFDAEKTPAGTYIYRLESPNVTISKKCLIIN